MLLIFDLDGTLIDSSHDLALAMNAMREYMGLPRINPNLIFSYVGNGAGVLVRRALGPNASEAEVAQALQFFLQFYGAHATANTRLYPGIDEAVSALSKEGHVLAVLTNKPMRISNQILTALGIDTCFRRVIGGDTLPAKKPDPSGILTLLQETGRAAAETVMIGDSAVDVRTARHAGVAAWGVSWGFQPESFDADPPDLLLGTANDLVRAAAHSQLVPTSE